MPSVELRRVPEGGIQPQVAVDAASVVHLIYMKGDPAQCDVFYVRSSDGGETWTAPIRVNSHPGSAVAIGTVRGAQLALGRGGRVHVAWIGSSLAQPKAPGRAAPMLYSRLREDGQSFEPERNVITSHVGLDGGGSIAADEKGNVYVAWHAPSKAGGDELDRRVWVARSRDDGKTFAPEVPISPAETGACGCCGLTILAADGKLWALYRGAAQHVNRDMYLVDATEDLSISHCQLIAPMKIGICVMSTSALIAGPQRPLGAWESNDRVFYGSKAQSVGQSERGQKHPALARNAAGQTLIAWDEGTRWNTGGSVAWRVFSAAGNPMAGLSGRADDLPVWGSPAAFARGNGSFVVLY